jgi:hypothetical protein
MPLPLSSTSFPIHNSPITISLEVMPSKLLKKAKETTNKEINK